MSPDTKSLWPDVGLGRLPYAENFPRLIRQKNRMPPMVVARKDNFDFEVAREIEGIFLRLVPLKPVQWNRFRAITGVKEVKELIVFSGSKEKGLPKLLQSNGSNEKFATWSIAASSTNIPAREQPNGWMFLLLTIRKKSPKPFFYTLGWVKKEELLQMAEVAEVVKESGLKLEDLRQEISQTPPDTGSGGQSGAF